MIFSPEGKSMIVQDLSAFRIDDTIYSMSININIDNTSYKYVIISYKHQYMTILRIA